MTLVRKADGTTEAFRVSKLRNSLRRAGATSEEVRKITRQVESELHDGIKTEAIYRRAFELLRGSEYMAATRYSLRRALFGLGPTGFPFEQFLTKLFEREGYIVKRGISVRGACAPHEIDVVAFKEGDCFIAEAKFHTHPGIKSDLQAVLYSYARFLDLKGIKVDRRDPCGVRRAFVITNTKFTTTAIAYAECVGVNLLSWDYPLKGNLQERVEAQNLYPVTVLQSLSGSEKRSLLARNIVLCEDLTRNRKILRTLNLSPKKQATVLEESERVCTGR